MALVIFTVFGQCVAGALLVSGLAWMREVTRRSNPHRAQHVLLWLVMGVGFIASVMHTGSPAQGV